jgi:hypothetical protein
MFDVSIMFSIFIFFIFCGGMVLLSGRLCWIRDPLERENELRYTIDPLGGGSNGGINRRTSMSVTDMSNLAAINNQQQRLCSVCCRRDVSCPFSSAVNPPATYTKTTSFQSSSDP